MKKLLTTLIYTALLSGIIFAQPQPPDTLWTKAYGGDEHDYGNSVRQTTDGGFIIAGTTQSFGANDRDVYLIKTDENGDTLWTRTFGGINLDEGSCVQQTLDGGYIIVGWTKPYGSSDSDVYLIKTDESGDTLWTRTFGGSYGEVGRCVQQTSDGGYIITGNTSSYGGCVDVYLIKTDAAGNELWYRTFGDSYYWDLSYSVQQTADGGYIIAGKTAMQSFEYFDVYLIKTDTNGDSIWTKIIGGPNGHGYANSVQQTTDGGYIIAGSTESYGAGNFDVYLIRADAQGDTLWTRTFGDSGDDQGNSVCQTVDGGYIIAGSTKPTDIIDLTYDAYLIKTDAYGDTSWTLIIGGDNDDMAYSVQQTFDEGYIVAGLTDATYYGSSEGDVWLIRFDSEGTLVEDFPAPHPSSFILHPCSPNPFNASTAISYQLQADSYVELVVYDVMGREVGRLMDGWQSAGTHQATFDAAKLPSGIYFARLSANGLIQTQKILLLK